MKFTSPTAVSFHDGYRPFPLGQHRCEAMFAGIEPFPTHCFPEPVEQFLQAQAVTQNCHVASIALPVLSVLASAIGSTRRLRLQANWTEPAVLWTATVAEPGLLRSPPLDAAVQPLRDREEFSFDEYETRLLEYEPLITRYRRAKRQYVGYGKIPVEPPAPVVDRYLASEWHLKSLTRVLKDQQRGLLLCTEELDGWIGRTLSVSNRRSEDLQTWLDLYECRTKTIDRQTGKRKTLQLPQPCVSVTGVVDPHLLVRKLTKAATPCVLASRLLMAMPVTEPMMLADEDLDDDIQLAYDTVVGELLRLPFEQKPRASTDQPPPSIETSPPQPERTRSKAAIVEVSREARLMLSAFLQEIAILKREIDPALAAWLANLPKQTARLALVLHLTRQAAGQAVDPTVCDATSMERAITLATWFANEAVRIVAVQSICSHDKEIFEFTDWLARRGGNATPREVCRSLNRLYPTFEHALKVMQKLVDTRVAVWKVIDPGPQGGRPVHYISMGVSPVPPADSFTYEDTWELPPKPEPAKPVKKGGKKPMTTADWDAMYPVSDEFRALIKGKKKEKGDE